jgi:alpha-amylase/alpha-mannosidase (GH57 family)
MWDLKKGGEHLLQERLIRYQFIWGNIDIYLVKKMRTSMKVFLRKLNMNGYIKFKFTS